MSDSINSRGETSIFSPSVHNAEDISVALVKNAQRSRLCGLISSVVGAVILLMIVILQIVPGAPIACSIVLGVALLANVVLSAGFLINYVKNVRKILNEISEVSTELTSTLSNLSMDMLSRIKTLNLGKVKKYSKKSFVHKSSLVENRSRSVREKALEGDTSIVSSTPRDVSNAETSDNDALSDLANTIEALTAPEVDDNSHYHDSIQSKIEKDDHEAALVAVINVDNSDESDFSSDENIDPALNNFLNNKLNCCAIYAEKQDGKKSSIFESKNYKSKHKDVLSAISSFCKGVTNLIEKKNAGLPLVSGTDVAKLFVPFVSKSSHPILSLTSSGSQIFKVADGGGYWLADILRDPLANLPPFVHLINHIRNVIP
ncbi:hypothetical protein CP10139811_0122A, partial [Chlamydia ibidis]